MVTVGGSGVRNCVMVNLRGPSVTVHWMPMSVMSAVVKVAAPHAGLLGESRSHSRNWQLPGQMALNAEVKQR